MAVTTDIVQDVLDAIEAALVTALPSNVTVIQDSDELTQERVGELASTSPTVVVAWNGTRSGEYATTNSTVDEFSVGVFATQPPTRQQYRYSGALRVVAGLQRTIANTVLGNEWGVDGVQVADNVECRNLTGADPRLEGYALVVLRWTQQLDLPPGIDYATLEDLTSVYSTVPLLDSPGGLTEDEFNTEITQ